MVGKNHDGGHLFSRMEARAKVLTSMSTVKRTISVYPSLEQLTDGTSKKYLLRDGEGAERYYVLELAPTFIAIETHTLASPLYFLKETMQRFLCIASLLSADYEINLGSLYPYLIEALAQEQLRHYAGRFESTRQKSDSDLVLAKRISELLRENAEMRSKVSVLEARSSMLLRTILLSRYYNGGSLGEVASDLGLTKGEVSSELRSMPRYGYRVLYKENERFALVRA